MSYRSCSPQDVFEINDDSQLLFQQSLQSQLEGTYRGSVDTLSTNDDLMSSPFAIESLMPTPLSKHTEPPSLPPLTTKPCAQPHSIQVLPAVETFPEKSSSSAPSSLFCTPLNSLQLENLNLAQAVSALSNVLSALSQDIDFSVSADSPNRIDGVVFISNHTVYFALYLHAHAQQQRGVTVEYRRMSGDSVSSARFWTQIQNSLQCKEPMDLDALELGELPPLDGFDGFDQSESSASLSSLLDDLEITFANEECYLSEELWCLSDAMATSPALCDLLWERRTLVGSLVGALESRDISVVRGAMLVLERLADHVEFPNLDEKDMERLCKLLQHPRMLIRKYAIRLLARLAEAKSTEWTMNVETREAMLQRLASFGDESSQMADEIQVVSEHMLGLGQPQMMIAVSN